MAQDNFPGSGERVIRGVEAMGKGLSEVGRGVRDAAATGVENVRETVRNRMPTERQVRDNVVMVRVDKDSLDRMDDLIEAGVVGSRSEAANYLITEGIKSRQHFFDVVASKVAEIRQAKEELRRLTIEEEEEEVPQD